MAKKKLTDEQRVMLVLEGLKGEEPVVDICKRYGVTTGYYYNLRDKFLEGGKSALKGKSPNKQVQKLKKEMKKQKEIIGELTIQNEILKKTIK